MLTLVALTTSQCSLFHSPIARMLKVLSLAVILSNNNNQRFNVCCFHACMGQTVSPLSPSSIPACHAHHSALTQVPSCPPQHILSTSSYSCSTSPTNNLQSVTCFNPVIIAYGAKTRDMVE